MRLKPQAPLDFVFEVRLADSFTGAHTTERIITLIWNQYGMEASQAERVSQLAKSLYNNRLAGSMDDATKMAESILSRTAAGEARSMQEMNKESPAVVTSNDAAGVKHNPAVSHKPQEKSETVSPKKIGSDTTKLDSLRTIVSEEEDRIAGLRAELDSIKESSKVSDSSISGVDSEVEKLARDIDKAKQDISEIHQHIRDLEDIKREIKQAEESQEQADEMAEEAEIIKERAEEWTPRESGDE